MSATLEAVLNDARKLSASDRKRLLDELGKGRVSKRKPVRKWDDDPVVISLREWVNNMEKNENSKENSAARIAEQIREWNHRNFEI